MSSKIATIALLSSSAFFGAIAIAATPSYPTNPERSYVSDPSPQAISRADARKELAEFRKNPVSVDHWKDVGGERGWVQVPHTFRYVAGRLEHTVDCDHSVASMQPSGGPGTSAYPDLYKNGS